MRNSWIIARRELWERIGSRSFLIMALIGPLLVLSMTYLLFVLGGNEQQQWKVLIADPKEIMENKIMAHKDQSVTYSFIATYVEIEEFANDPKYRSFDALVEVNEKVLTNKVGFVFYREKPSMNMSISLRYHVERRLEEILAEEFTDLSQADFRKIKQPLTLNFRNVYDPTDSASDLGGWVGLFFGTVIFIFIFFFISDSFD